MERLEEIWRPVKEHQNYEVSNLGFVRRAKDHRVLHQSCNQAGGYLRVALDRKKYYVHRLVAQSFGIVKSGEDVLHVDGNRLDNSVLNLMGRRNGPGEDGYEWPD